MANDQAPDNAAAGKAAAGQAAVGQPVVEIAPRRKLTPEAERALAEAEARRKAAAPVERPKELGGRNGPEPARFGDWESKGIASDF